MVFGTKNFFFNNFFQTPRVRNHTVMNLDTNMKNVKSYQIDCYTYMTCDRQVVLRMFFFVRVVFKNVFSCMEYFLENPTSRDSNMYSLELVIGSVIGSFVLALILGLVLGLLFGIKFTRTYNVKQVNSSMNKIDLNKGPLYEEVEIDKNVELTQNISYETVKNMK